MTNRITLTNDFHDSGVTLQLRSAFPSTSQVRRSWKALCGIKGCACGDVMGMRGPQAVKITGQEYSRELGEMVPSFAK